MPCSAVSVLCAASASSFSQYIEVKSLGGEFARQILQGLDLGGRQSEPSEALGAGAAQGVVMKRIERGADAGPDRRRTRGGQLLAADDRRKAGITGLAPPQRRHPCELQYRLQSRILLDQRVDGAVEVGLGVEVDGHCELESPCPVKEINAAACLPFCAEPERLSASRPCLFGVAEFRFGAADRRPVPAADRGYRPDPLQAGIRDRDLWDLDWLGIAWEQPVRRQSRHLADYRDAVERLSARGLRLSEFRKPGRDRKIGRAA